MCVCEKPKEQMKPNGENKTLIAERLECAWGAMGSPKSYKKTVGGRKQGRDGERGKEGKEAKEESVGPCPS